MRRFLFALFAFFISSSASFADYNGPIFTPPGGAPGINCSFEGVVPSNLIDNTVAEQNCVNAAKTSGYITAYMPPGQVGQASSVFVPYGIRVCGQYGTQSVATPSTYLVPISGGSFTTDQANNPVMWGFGTTDMVHWASGATGQYFFGGGACHLLFYDVNAIAGITGAVSFGGNVTFEDIGGYEMLQTLVRGATPTSGGTGEYSDAFHLLNPRYSSPQNSAVAQFDIQGSGDILDIQGGNFPPATAGACSLAIKIEGVNGTGGDNGNTFGATVRNTLNGNIQIDANGPTLIDVWHNEGCSLTVGDGTNTSLTNSYFKMWNGQGVPIQTTQGSTGSKLHLANNEFDWFGFGNYNYAGVYEVELNPSVLFSSEDNFLVAGGASTTRSLFGIDIVEGDGATALATWNQFSDHLSRKGKVESNYFVPLDITLPPRTTAYNGIFSAALSSTGVSGSWTIATGTYYYTSLRIYDPVSMLGEPSIKPEQSVNVSATTNLVSLGFLVAATNGAPHGYVRVYRGTSTGSYNAYADVPITQGVNLVDNGTQLSGFNWVSRGAGAVDTIVAAQLGFAYRITAPGVETYQTGSYHYPMTSLLNASTVAGATDYLSLSGKDNSLQTVAQAAEQILPAGILGAQSLNGTAVGGMRCAVNSAPGVGFTDTFTLVTGTQGSLSAPSNGPVVTITGTSPQSVLDSTHSAVVTDNQYAAIQLTASAGATATGRSWCWIYFWPTP
ncbi:MAG TPA: hypothetical protein VNX86_04780 [Rhizomicrobium sp.]|jgi:hypothetical protein|nr:hypothetical protein [Rhizomicrobium sp.]